MSRVQNVVLRFDLDDETQRKALEYLRTKDRKRFKSNAILVSKAIAAFLAPPANGEDTPYLESREREEYFIERIVGGVTNTLNKTLPAYFLGFVSGMSQDKAGEAPAALPGEQTKEKSKRPKENPNVDWGFVTGQGKVRKQSKS